MSTIIDPFSVPQHAVRSDSSPTHSPSSSPVFTSSLVDDSETPFITADESFGDSEVVGRLKRAPRTQPPKPTGWTSQSEKKGEGSNEKKTIAEKIAGSSTLEKKKVASLSSLLSRDKPASSSFKQEVKEKTQPSSASSSPPGAKSTLVAVEFQANGMGGPDPPLEKKKKNSLTEPNKAVKIIESAKSHLKDIKQLRPSASMQGLFKDKKPTNSNAGVESNSGLSVPASSSVAPQNSPATTPTSPISVQTNVNSGTTNAPPSPPASQNTTTSTLSLVSIAPIYSTNTSEPLLPTLSSSSPVVSPIISSKPSPGSPAEAAPLVVTEAPELLTLDHTPKRVYRGKKPPPPPMSERKIPAPPLFDSPISGSSTIDNTSAPTNAINTTSSNTAASTISTISAAASTIATATANPTTPTTPTIATSPTTTNIMNAATIPIGTTLLAPTPVSTTTATSITTTFPTVDTPNGTAPILTSASATIMTIASTASQAAPTSTRQPPPPPAYPAIPALTDAASSPIDTSNVVASPINSAADAPPVADISETKSSPLKVDPLVDNLAPEVVCRASSNSEEDEADTDSSSGEDDDEELGVSEDLTDWKVEIARKVSLARDSFQTAIRTRVSIERLSAISISSPRRSSSMIRVSQPESPVDLTLGLFSPMSPSLKRASSSSNLPSLLMSPPSPTSPSFPSLLSPSSSSFPALLSPSSSSSPALLSSSSSCPSPSSPSQPAFALSACPSQATASPPSCVSSLESSSSSPSTSIESAPLSSEASPVLLSPSSTCNNDAPDTSPSSSSSLISTPPPSTESMSSCVSSMSLSQETNFAETKEEEFDWDAALNARHGEPEEPEIDWDNLDREIASVRKASRRRDGVLQGPGEQVRPKELSLEEKISRFQENRQKSKWILPAKLFPIVEKRIVTTDTHCDLLSVALQDTDIADVLETAKTFISKAEVMVMMNQHEEAQIYFREHLELLKECRLLAEEMGVAVYEETKLTKNGGLIVKEKVPCVDTAALKKSPSDFDENEYEDG